MLHSTRVPATMYVKQYQNVFRNPKTLGTTFIFIFILHKDWDWDGNMKPAPEPGSNGFIFSFIFHEN
jgi:hypothetical protein